MNRFFDPPADGGPNVVFFEGPGRDNKALPPPTLRVPSLIALEEEVNGSGAATFESFCNPTHGQHQSEPVGVTKAERKQDRAHLFAFFADHGLVSIDEAWGLVEGESVGWRSE